MGSILRSVVCGLVVATVAVACGTDGDPNDATPASTTTITTTTTTTTTTAAPTTAPTTTAAPEPTVRASSGCDHDPTPAGAQGLTLDTADGLVREYRRFVPGTYDAAAATPLVLNFHGYTSNIAQQVGLSRLEPLSEAETFIVATPQGVLDSSGTTFWNVPPLADPSGPDDVAFIHELLDELEANLCIDLDRIFATGMSNGGFMSSHLGCKMPERIAAYASVTGITRNVPCDDTSRPATVLHFHGTDDNVVNFDLSALVIDAWVAAAGCSTEVDITTISDEVELREFPRCAEGSEIDFYVIEGGGHTWPGTELPAEFAAVLGYTTLDIDATALAWEWFERHPMG